MSQTAFNGRARMQVDIQYLRAPFVRGRSLRAGA